jgi:hypothetical protein
MKFSPYSRLDDNDIMIKGDEIRFATRRSSLSQYCDPSLDEERMRWTPITKYWIGHTFGEFRKGLTKPKSYHNHGRIECRRKIILTPEERK